MNHYTPLTLSELGPLIASVRTEAGLSQKQLAKKIGVTNPAVSMWESGKRTPALKTFFDIMTVCNKQIYYVNQ